jgi:DNA repair protein RadC
MLPPGQRPRERLLQKGPDELTEVELIAILLQGGTRRHSALDLASILLSRCGGLAKLATRTPSELASVPGVGPAKAAQLLAALELGRRCQEAPLEPGAQFTSSRELDAHYRPRLRDRKRELFLALLLDGKNRIIREERISEGSLTASIVHPREVFAPAIRESAAAVAFVHNHPSGDPAPSRQDLDVTRRLVQTGEVIGIRVLDHVIIGVQGYFSFADAGLLQP